MINSSILYVLNSSYILNIIKDDRESPQTYREG